MGTDEATNAGDAINVLAAHAVDIALSISTCPELTVGTCGENENSPQDAPGGGVRKRPGRDYWPSQGT
jgi:hypothetical protein